MKEGMEHLQKDKRARGIQVDLEFWDIYDVFPSPGKVLFHKAEHKTTPVSALETRKLVLKIGKLSKLFDRSTDVEETKEAGSNLRFLPSIGAGFNRYIAPMLESPGPREHSVKRELLEIMLREKDKQLERIEQEINALASRIQSAQNQKRMDISYALASEDARTILSILVKKIALPVNEVAQHLTESDVLKVVCDLSKARLANLKGKKLIITSLGLKVAKKLQSVND